MRSFFITGIGTDVGKTIVSAILTEALQADYWKPVQSGLPADKDRLKDLLTNNKSVVHKEVYKLQTPVSPHLAAQLDGVEINLDNIVSEIPDTENILIIEGAGGLMVPLNENEFIIDLIQKFGSRVILVSDHYLGSINHSLMTAKVLESYHIEVAGWVFNNGPSVHEANISKWSKLPVIASITKLDKIDKAHIEAAALELRPLLQKYL